MNCAHEFGRCIANPPCLGATSCAFAWVQSSIDRLTAARSAPTVYRHFDQDGTLLYVGRSLNVMSRIHAHRQVSPWWNSVATITIERFATQDEAVAAELHAIRTEGPLHNRAGVPA